MRRPETNVPVAGDSLVVRQWFDFFMDVYTAISKVREIKFANATIDFPSIAALATATSNVTVKGARANDIVTLGLPATVDAGIVFDARVSANDTITIRATNITLGAIDPSSAIYRVLVTMTGV